MGKRYGDAAYAAEELVAEIGAAMLCAGFGLATETREENAAYVASWLALVMKADKRGGVHGGAACAAGG